jgi:hypothetical protein
LWPLTRWGLLQLWRALARGLRTLRVLQGHAEDLSRTEVKLRAKLNRLRAQADYLEAAANRPIEAAIASDERVAWQYGDAAAGKNGEHK